MKILLIILVVIILLLAGLGLFAKYKVDQLPDKQDLIGSIDREVNKLFADQTSHALVIGVFKQGRTHVRGYGVMAKDTDTTVSRDTVFQIGSISKVFTASLLQTLSDNGVVKMDATLDELIGDSYTLSAKTANITLQQLATHTSGLPRIPKAMMDTVESLAGKDDVMDDPYTYLTPDDMFAYLANAEDTKAPGKFAYSNYGMGLLGHVLEKLTDTSYEQLLQQYLFIPMGMSDSGIEINAVVGAKLAQGYDADGDEAGVWHFSVLAGAGAVYSNVRDMLRFIQLSLEPGSDANLRFEKMRKPFGPGKSGLGWMQAGMFERFFGNASYVWHNGQVGGYASYIAISAQDDAGVIVLSSQSIDVTMLGTMLVRQLRTQSWAK